MPAPLPRLILASASPARLQTLRSAGLRPEVVISGVDEDAVVSDDPSELALKLARLKAVAVAADQPRSLVIGADSVLELDGQVFGKPVDESDAEARWRELSGNTGVLHTGHCVIDTHREVWVARAAATQVRFASVSAVEIAAYVATGEPLKVAGAFTLDGLGSAFVSGITGDPHNVIGLSVPLLRLMFDELGYPWHEFWVAPVG